MPTARACACTEYATTGLQLEKLLLVVLVGLPAVLLASRRARQLELKPDQGHANYTLCAATSILAVGKQEERCGEARGEPR